MNPEDFDADIAAYARTGAPVLLLIFDRGGRVLWSGDYSRTVLRSDPAGRPFAEVFARVPANRGFDAWRPADGVEANVDLRLPGNLPQTWRVVFSTREDSVLGLGRRDTAEIEGLELNLLSLNAELSNRTRELHKANAELEQLDTLKNRFLGMAAHDLRTPLGVIMSYSELLEDDANTGMKTEHREFVTAIRNSSKFMLALINDLLDVATIESGNLTLEREWVDLPAFLAENIAFNRVLATRKHITLAFDPPMGFPAVSLDRRRFEQVMNNLLGNAVKYSERGTTTTIVLSRRDNRAEIAVSDEGPGIPREKIDQLFQPFSRVGTRATGNEPSTGLGLLIAHKIVEGHGGTIRVDPTTRSGTTFLLELPLAETDPDASG